MKKTYHIDLLYYCRSLNLSLDLISYARSRSLYRHVTLLWGGGGGGLPYDAKNGYIGHYIGPLFSVFYNNEPTQSTHLYQNTILLVATLPNPCILSCLTCLKCFGFFRPLKFNRCRFYAFVPSSIFDETFSARLMN